MQYIGIDVETFSGSDVKKQGVHKHVNDPLFEITIFGVTLPTGRQQFDIARKEDVPAYIFDILVSPDWIKTSHGAVFEITTIEKHFGITLIYEQWQCTMIRSAMSGYPLGLDSATKAMRLNVTKNASGKGLIQLFAKPIKPTKINGGKIRMHALDSPAKWEKFKQYNIDDLIAEEAEKNFLDQQGYEISQVERDMWLLDMKINRRGIYIDTELVNNAIALDNANREKLKKEAIEITGLANPNSRDQLLTWLSEETGETRKKLRKEDVINLIKTTEDKIVVRVLEIRQAMSKSSISKYFKFIEYLGKDGRVRDTIQHYGANRTGRFAGRGPQPHNLPQTLIYPLDAARRLLLAGSAAAIEVIFGDLSNVLSKLIRTAFIASPGYIFGVPDYAAIEARVIAWLADEKWRMEVFRGDGRIYEASAAKMFKIAIEKVTEEIRKKGKVSELALGFEGGDEALIRMGALEMGLTRDELPGIKTLWRKENPGIVDLWKRLKTAAIRCIQNPGSIVSVGKGVKFQTLKGVMYIILPSGRKLCYVRPRIEKDDYGRDVIVYDGKDGNVWGRQYTYGGKLAENITQAIARDILVVALLRLDKAKFLIAFHVHDEIIAEIPYANATDKKLAPDRLAEMSRLMEIPMPWAPDLPLKAKGYLSSYYKKD